MKTFGVSRPCSWLPRCSVFIGVLSGGWSLSHTCSSPIAVSLRNMTSFANVNVTEGTLRGRKVTSKFGSTYFSFQGVPYAKPPLGPLRFKAPQQPESWEGVRDALAEGPVCPHKDWITQEFVGKEECLFLNVYTPELPGGGAHPRKAVMVWIHGGGFAIGSGNTDLYGPDYLVDAGVIVVTINYRLGALGFLSLEDSSMPGNAGLKDQVAALAWVKQNISEFGGDPDNVTLFGESAGGASVHYHLLSPMSKGLFHRAISQSGSSLNPWAMTESLRSRTFKLGEVLGCKTTDSQELLNFLRSVSPRDLVDGTTKTVSKDEKRRGNTLPFLPIPEKNSIEGEEVFLPEHPLKLLKAGKFHHVPYITGITSHEGILELDDILKHPEVVKTIDDDFERVVPSVLNVHNDSKKEHEISLQIKKFYFGDKPFTKETLLQYVNLSTDIWFAHGVDTTVKLQAAITTSPIYYYQFSFDGDLGFFKRLIGAGDIPGASHIDDIGYLFRMSVMDVDIDPQSSEMKTLRRMIKMWTNFAKTGNPIPEPDSDVNVKWTPYSLSNPVYLNIDTELSLSQDMEKKRMTFWNELYHTVNNASKL